MASMDGTGTFASALRPGPTLMGKVYVPLRARSLIVTTSWCGPGTRSLKTYWSGLSSASPVAAWRQSADQAPSAERLEGGDARHRSTPLKDHAAQPARRRE